MNICCRFKGQLSSTPCRWDLSLLLSEEFFQCSAPIETSLQSLSGRTTFVLLSLNIAMIKYYSVCPFAIFETTYNRYVFWWIIAGLSTVFDNQKWLWQQGWKDSCRSTVICPHCLCDCTPLMPPLRVMTLHVKYATVSFLSYLHNLKVQTNIPFLSCSGFFWPNFIMLLHLLVAKSNASANYDN